MYCAHLVLDALPPPTEGPDGDGSIFNLEKRQVPFATVHSLSAVSVERRVTLVVPSGFLG